MKRKRPYGIVIALSFLIFSSPPAHSHPELVFYIDTAANIHNEGNQIFLDYYIAKSDQLAFLDLALVAGDLDLLAQQECKQVKEQLHLAIGEFKVPLTLNSARAIEKLPSTGAGTWVECRYSSEVDFFGENQFAWRDDNFAEIPGHREFNLGLGTSPSLNLTDYTSVLALLNQRSSTFAIKFPVEEEIEVTSDTKPQTKPTEVLPSPESSSSPLPAKSQEPSAEIKQSWLTTTSNKYFRTLNPTPLIVAIGILIAFLLGALHSIAPGHGKSIMAVMALAEGGKRREIIRLGLTMGATHTVGVLILGTFFILGSSAIPRSIIPTLGIVSGFLICVIGSLYIVKYLRHRREHAHGVEHHHHEVEVGATRIALLGIVGGMVPTPTAITILVGTAALGSAWYGVLLVGSYGIGMTAILIFAGRLVERLYRLAQAVVESGSRLSQLISAAPFMAAFIQVIAGVFLVAISYRALM